LNERSAPHLGTKGSTLRFGYRFNIYEIISNALTAALFGLADSEHLGAAGWAHALVCRSAVFHRDFFRVFHFSLCLAFYTISFHRFSSLNLSKLWTRLFYCRHCKRVGEFYYFCDDEKIQKKWIMIVACSFAILHRKQSN